MNQGKMPGWLVVLLALAAVVFLGPPLLVLVLGAFGVALALGGVALKVGVVVLAVYGLVMLLRGASAPGAGRTTLSPAGGAPLSAPSATDEKEKQETLAALDLELERAIHARKAGGPGTGEK